MNAIERQLLHVFREINPTDQAAVVAFAEFLSSRNRAAAPPVPTEPLDIPRPEHESVVKAVKRLRQTYPMLDPGKLLDETSHFMTQHLVHGRPAADIIDDMEALFRRHFEQHRTTSSLSDLTKAAAK